MSHIDLLDKRSLGDLGGILIGEVTLFVSEFLLIIFFRMEYSQNWFHMHC